MLYDKRWELDQAGHYLLAIADYIEEHGWCQGVGRNVEGRVCLSYALHSVSPNWHENNEMYRRLHLATGAEDTLFRWNDEPGRTREEVVSACRRAAWLT